MYRSTLIKKKKKINVLLFKDLTVNTYQWKKHNDFNNLNFTALPSDLFSQEKTCQCICFEEIL